MLKRLAMKAHWIMKENSLINVFSMFYEKLHATAVANRFMSTISKFKTTFDPFDDQKCLKPYKN